MPCELSRPGKIRQCEIVVRIIGRDLPFFGDTLREYGLDSTGLGGNEVTKPGCESVELCERVVGSSPSVIWRKLGKI